MFSEELIKGATKQELVEIIDNQKQNLSQWLLNEADRLRQEHYGKKVFVRGLVEFSNYCTKACHYCGISRKNSNITRYRLTPQQILECIKEGHGLGFRSFVLQSGEDSYYNSGSIVDVVYSIKERYPDSSLTLSLGELSDEIYRDLYSAGADRFLLRHETANSLHYNKLHPDEMTFESRKRCLYTLKEIGFATGAGFMVQSPYQTSNELAEDLLFLKELSPHMVGIGPFIAQEDTKFATFESGTLNTTLAMIALTRLMLPKAMIPSTTALSTIDETGREQGLRAGGNVVMPNITPTVYREDYRLYDGKTGTDISAGDGLEIIKRSIIKAGYIPDFSRGDYAGYKGRAEDKI